MTPHHSSIVLLTFVTVFLLPVAVARGENDPVDPEDSLHAHLERLNHNIERIATLLERSLEGQHLELLIQRVEMGASRLAVAEQNLHSAQTTRSSINNERAEIEARMVQIADGLDRGSLEMTAEEAEQYTGELDLHLRLLRDRLRDADREIIELENEVMRQRGNIRDWQDYIDEELTSQR